MKPFSHGDESKFHCKNVGIRDISKNRKALYKNQSKVEQDAHLSRFISVYDSARGRQSKTVPQKIRPKHRSASFSLTINDHHKTVYQNLIILLEHITKLDYSD